jgi:hypothetical protein
MKISPVIQQLRIYCPSFAGRVAGGLDWDPTEKSANTALPAAFVIAVGDTAEESKTNIVRQDVRDEFDVCVVLVNKDERGQAANDQLHIVRGELWRALVGFVPDEQSEPLQYDGSALLLIDRSRAVYRYRFFTEFQLGRNSKDEPPETWQERELDGLPPLEGLDIDVDYIEPMCDKNLTESGPDGRIEMQLREDLPQ